MKAFKQLLRYGWVVMWWVVCVVIAALVVAVYVGFGVWLSTLFTLAGAKAIAFFLYGFFGVLGLVLEERWRFKR